METTRQNKVPTRDGRRQRFLKGTHMMQMIMRHRMGLSESYSETFLQQQNKKNATLRRVNLHINPNWVTFSLLKHCSK